VLTSLPFPPSSPAHVRVSMYLPDHGSRITQVRYHRRAPPPSASAAPIYPGDRQTAFLIGPGENKPPPFPSASPRARAFLI